MGMSHESPSVNLNEEVAVGFSRVLKSLRDIRRSRNNTSSANHGLILSIDISAFFQSMDPLFGFKPSKQGKWNFLNYPCN